MSNLDQQIVLDEMFPGDTSKAWRFGRAVIWYQGKQIAKF